MNKLMKNPFADRRLQKYAVAVLWIVSVLIGCSKNNEIKPIDEGTVLEEGAFLEKLNSAPYVEVSKEDLPEWLVVRINDSEQWEPLHFIISIYKGEWENQTVFFIVDTRSACICDIFTEDGKKVVDNLSDCHAKSRNWVCIYGDSDFLNLSEIFH